jgi:hypothetical protein
MAASTRPKPAAARQAVRPVLRREGRATASRSSAEMARRSATMPTGPTVGNRVTAMDAPTSWQISPRRTSQGPREGLSWGAGVTASVWAGQTRV